MAAPVDTEFILRVLAHADMFGPLADALEWRCDGEYAPITFFVNCNDAFWWGTADLERITPDNLAVLEQAITDLRAIGNLEALCYVWLLFCARVRQMRPQGCVYPKNRQADLWPLLDACGPERAIDMNNPYRPGERK